MEVKAADSKAPALQFFVEYFDENDELDVMYGDTYNIEKEMNRITWKIPDTKGHAIYRLGFRLTSEKRLDGSIIIKSLDWSNAPKVYRMGRSMEMSPSLTPWTTTTAWLKAFVSSADHFNPDYTVTFSICHAAENGVVTTGTEDWADYTIKTRMTLSQQDLAGLVGRAKGHRRYYGAALANGNAIIYRQQDEKRIEVAKVPYDYQIDDSYDVEFILKGDALSFLIDGKEAVSGHDNYYSCGQAGFVVDSGAILADGFEIRAVN